MRTTLIVLGLLCVVMVLLPAKYDPAIRLKQWVERTWRRR
jgi:hypothetical protein